MGLSNELSCESGNFSSCCFNPHRIFQSLDVLFPCTGTLGCGVCLTPQLFLPVYLHVNVEPPGLLAAALLGPPATALPQVLSAPPARLCPSYRSG